MAQGSISNAVKHFKTITNHKRMVLQGCFKIGLYRQGLTHDLSKYSPVEFMAGVRFYQGDRSPNNAERELYGYSKAWLHHKGRSKHHFEYWWDYNIDSEYYVAGSKMPRRYIAEMIVDRVSASKNYRGAAYTQSDPLDYFLNCDAKAWFIHEDVKRDMRKLLTMVAERGEDATYRYIKNVYLKELD